LVFNRPKLREASGGERGGEVTGIRILECDPELGLRVPAGQITKARDLLVAPPLSLDIGMWEPPSEPGGLGFLMVDGVLARDVVLAGKTCTELLGPGDVLHPSPFPAPDSLVRYRVLWHVLEPARFAVLSDEVNHTLAEFPQVLVVLVERSLGRAHRVAMHAALLELSPVETRLLVLFWLLAERWGRVTPHGVTVGLRLSHKMLGQLVGCQRASVTTALHHIEESGLIARRANRTWLLRGAPPDELVQLRWDGRDLAEPAPARALFHG
jgi:CRP/FNR family transcriptional regulator, cyclic AMP receptor protein